MMTCKEASEASIRKTEGTISLKMRFDLAMHTFFCKYCKLFAKQQALLNQFFSYESHRMDELSPTEKSNMNSIIQRS